MKVTDKEKVLVAFSGGETSAYMINWLLINEPNNEYIFVFANTGEEVIHIKNGGASATTVTITSAQQCNQGFSHDLTVTIAAGADKFIGPFPTNRFNNSNGLTTFACSVITSVTAAVMRIRG